MRPNSSIFRTVLLSTGFLFAGVLSVIASSPTTGDSRENIRVAGSPISDDTELSALAAEVPAAEASNVDPPDESSTQGQDVITFADGFDPLRIAAAGGETNDDASGDQISATGNTDIETSNTDVETSNTDVETSTAAATSTKAIATDPVETQNAETAQETAQQPVATEAADESAEDPQVPEAAESGDTTPTDEEVASPSGEAPSNGDVTANVRVVDTDAGCTSAFCPNGIGLEPTEISGNSATFAFFPIPDADPTFTLRKSFSRDADESSLPELITTGNTLTITGLSEGSQYALTADRNFGFAAGSASETIYFQAPSPATDRYCDQFSVTFENDLIMQAEGSLFSSISPVGFDPACGQYDVWLHSSDPNHDVGYQPYQLGEQWRLEGLNSAGEILYSSPSSPDLPEAQKVGYYNVDRMYGPGVTQVRAAHTGEGNINSVHAAASFIPVSPNLRTPDLCGSVDVLFLNPSLVNGADPVDRATVGMSIEAPAREYQLWLYSRDDAHALGESGGAAEQWFVEGLDAAGNVVYTSPVAPDLPDDQVLGQALVGTVTLDNIVSFRGRHLGREADNTVEASMMLVPVGVELPDEPYPLWCKQLNIQRP